MGMAFGWGKFAGRAFLTDDVREDMAVLRHTISTNIL
jgi:hypothetical protein